MMIHSFTMARLLQNREASFVTHETLGHECLLFRDEVETNNLQRYVYRQLSLGVLEMLLMKLTAFTLPLQGLFATSLMFMYSDPRFNRSVLPEIKQIQPRAVIVRE